jgi:hypothetical protein
MMGEGKEATENGRLFRTEAERLIGEVENNIVEHPAAWTKANF